jgi:hypothetical protein
MPTMEERYEAYRDLGTEDLLADLEAGLTVLVKRLEAERQDPDAGISPALRFVHARTIHESFQSLAKQIKGEV